MKSTYDFHLIRGILLKAEAGEACEGSTPEHQLLAPYFKEAIGTTIYKMRGGETIHYRLWGLKESGQKLLELLRDESLLVKAEAYAGRNGMQLSLTNITAIVQEEENQKKHEYNAHLITFPNAPIAGPAASRYSNRVFIVHGRNAAFRDEVKQFIEELGLEPIILAEQANRSRTIIEKIEAYSDVGFAVVLYTGCDVGMLKDSMDMRPRARQNVVLEHGYFMGKLGRERVAAIMEPGVETPNDISGVVYIGKDEDWRAQLRRELEDVGYKL